MNASNAKDYLPLIQAMAEGKSIQFRIKPELDWIDVDEVSDAFGPGNFRIKPEPREIWFNRYEHEVYHGPYPSKAEAEGDAMNFATQVRYREVIE